MTEQSKQVCGLLQAAQKEWNPPALPQKAADMPQGDMPGDAVHISEAHRTKADAIFPLLLPQLAEICARNPYGRAVITVCGGSGSGKTGAAALLGYYFKQIGVGSYVLSGDNYPRRYPALNDAERLRIFRQGGMHGLTSGALLNPDVWQQLHTWQNEQRDADPLCVPMHLGWLCTRPRGAKHWLDTWVPPTSRILMSWGRSWPSSKMVQMPSGSSAWGVMMPLCGMIKWISAR